MAKKSNTTPDFVTPDEAEPKGEDLTKSEPELQPHANDVFIKDIQTMSQEKVKVNETQGMNIAEPEDAEILVINSSFFNWRDENDEPYIGKVFVGQYLGKHKNPAYETDPIGNNEILGYDFRGADGKDYILGDNYSLEEALSVEKAGVKLMDMKPGPVLWIKLIGIAKAKKGDFNQYKIKLITKPVSK